MGSHAAMDELAEFKRTFFLECDELLASLEGQLTALKDGQVDDELLHAAFRAIHSIKGGAGAFGFTALVTFAHAFESTLDLMRSHKLEIEDVDVGLLIRAGDVLADLVEAARADVTPPADLGSAVLQGLRGLAGSGETADDGGGVVEEFTPRPAERDPPAPPQAAMPAPRRVVAIRFAPAADMLRRANEPLLLIRDLKRLGTLSTRVDLSRLPPLEEMEPDGAYLGWAFELETGEPPSAVDEVFEFVLDDCMLVIDDPATATPASTAGPSEANAAAERPEVGRAPGAEPTQPRPTATATATGAGPAKAPALDQKGAAIRVDLDRIDRLVNMVGELVITQAMLSQQAEELTDDLHGGLLIGIATLALRSRELQEAVMAIRAQPVKSVFSRMSRLVRELSTSLGKEARLVVTGEHTEVDKTVIEELADPLTHMIRNSMDHGIEAPEQRVAVGKPREGLIELSAEHRSGRILISVGDDGQGVNRAKVLQKAINRGLVAAGAQLSDEEIDNLLFLPGFSTADQVSSVSGRGVGMDVVKRNIMGMGGRVSIASTPGRGSRFTLTLPLTLAVLDGMIVKVGSEAFIVPITSIVESTRPAAAKIHQLAGGGQVMSDRGDYIRLVYLYRLFGLAGAVTDASQGLVVVVEIENGSRIGLVVDELLGQQQVVIKSLEANYRRVDGVSSATILGNGMVALILDVDGLAVMAHACDTPHARPPQAAVREGACL